MSFLLRKSVYATALSAAVGAIALSTAGPAQASIPNCEWIDCVPRNPVVVTVPPIKWPPGPQCLSCPFELRDFSQLVVQPQVDVGRFRIADPPVALDAARLGGGKPF
jgi:hypothetical protein